MRQKRTNPREGIETDHRIHHPVSKPYASSVRKERLPVRGLKRHLHRLGQVLGEALQSEKRIPVRGLKPTTERRSQSHLTLVRKEQIPVRGLKQNSTGFNLSLDFCVRKERIPVRGLKQAGQRLWIERTGACPSEKNESP